MVEDTEKNQEVMPSHELAHYLKSHPNENSIGRELGRRNVIMAAHRQQVQTVRKLKSRIYLKRKMVSSPTYLGKAYWTRVLWIHVI